MWLAKRTNCRRLAASLLAGGLAAGGATAFADQDTAGASARASRVNPTAIRLEGQAVRILNRADRQVQRKDKACRFDGPPAPRPPIISDATPTPGLLGMLGVLRRPPTRSELDSVSSGLTGPFFTVLYRRYVRIVPGPGRLQARVSVGLSEPLRPPLLFDPRCRHEVDRAIASLLRQQPHAIRDHVRRIRSRFPKLSPISPGPQESLSVFLEDPSHGTGGGGGAFDLHSFRTHGAFGSQGSGGPLPPGVGGLHGRHTIRPHKPRSLLYGLVPDGVATVTLTLPKRVARGPYAPDALYPSSYTATAHVHDNFVILAHVPRDAPDALGRMVWRNTQGQVIRVVKMERSPAALTVQAADFSSAPCASSHVARTSWGVL